METDLIIGIIILAFSLIAVIGLTLWCKFRIEKISKSGCCNTRQVIKSLGKKES